MVTKNTPKKAATKTSNSKVTASATDYKANVEKFKESVLNHLRTTIGTSPAKASK